MKKQGERGFSTIELIVACAIIAPLSCAATMTIGQTINSTQRNENQVIAIRDVQNAGFWISRDTQMAESIVTENLEYPNLVILSWTEQNYEGGDSIYHSATYFFENLSGGVGELKRRHWNSAGVDENTLIAKHLYYDPSDPANTSNASYQDPVLTVKLHALVSNASETREYQSIHRPTFQY